MDRFKKVYRQGTIEVIEIWIDTENRCQLSVSPEWECVRFNTITEQGRQTGCII